MPRHGPPFESFALADTPARLRAFSETGDLRVEASERGLAIRGGGEPPTYFEPPLLLPLREGETPDAYRRRIEAGPRRCLLLLIQAGASAMGLWEGDELVAHKVIKKYVVRGKGRAQPTHLKTRGKSRYGSRLRLRNAEAQLVQTNEKLASWFAQHGEADDVFVSCPKRTVPELFACTPPPPFSREALVRIPLDVHVPDFEELKNVYRKMSRGRIRGMRS